MNGDARRILIERLSRNGDDEAAWVALFDLEASQGKFDAALTLLGQRHQSRRDAARFAFTAIHRLAAGRHWDGLRTLYDGAPKDSAFLGFFAYGAALGAAHRFQLDATARLLREAAYHTLASREKFFRHEPNEFLGEILPIAGMIEKAGYESGSPSPIALDLPPLAPAGPLLLACCDDRYFCAYAERFLRSLNAALPNAAFLIHVINPDADGQRLRTRLAKEFPAGAFSFETGPSDAAFFAGRRFMIAATVRRRYGADIAIVDMDSVFAGAFERLLARARQAPVAYIAPPGNILPTLLVSGAFLCVKADAAADAFLDRCQAYLQRKFAAGEGGWYIDQAALFRAVCISRETGGAILDLAADDPTVLDGLVGPHIVAEATRLSWRSRNRSVSGVTFDGDLRPTYHYVDAKASETPPRP